VAAAGHGCLTLCHVGSGSAAPAASRSPAERCCPGAGLPCPAEERGTAQREARGTWCSLPPAACKLGSGRTSVVDGGAHGTSSSDVFLPARSDLPFLMFPVSVTCWWKQREWTL